MEGSNEEINACIQLYGVRHIVINVFHASELENYADGQRIVDLVANSMDGSMGIWKAFNSFIQQRRLREESNSISSISMWETFRRRSDKDCL
jgi:hypothetical protein